MAQVELDVNGDATGGVNAVQETSNALSGLQGATSGANAALGSSSEKVQVFGEYTRGSAKLLSAFAASAGEASGPLQALDADAAGAASGLASVGAAAIRGASALGPWGAVAFGALAGINALVGGTEQVAPAMTDAERSAQDLAMVFPQVGAGAGVLRSSVDATAAGLLQLAGQLPSTGSAAGALASDLLMAAGASDEAATAHSVHASALQMLMNSQASALGGMHAMVGGLSDVVAMAERAGMSYAEFAATLGTQITVPAPNMPSAPEFRASGGPVAAGQAYIVGEHGPELFMPGRAGAIVPAGGFDRGSNRAPSAGSGEPWGGTTVIFAPQYNQNAPAYGFDDLRRTVLDWTKDAFEQYSHFRGNVEEH